ncbi:MAG: hypothetical protein ACFFD9_09525 [Candidatus Thorarchaeota archaeon]
MDKEIETRLQASRTSGEIIGYLCARLPDTGLQSGWIERGLTAKGLKGTLKSKANRERYLAPADQSVRLMSDRAMDAPRRYGLVVLGERGLTKSKFSVFLSDLKSSPSGGKHVAAFWSEGYTPHDIVRFVIRYGLGESLSAEFDEPNLDYVEQLKTDFSDKKVREGICLQIPKDKFDPATWVKKSMRRSDDAEVEVLFRSEKLRQTPAFALLYSRWLQDLDLYQTMKQAVSCCLFVRDEEIEVAIWDLPRRIATFVIFASEPLEEITRKYLLPAWLAKGEEIQPPTPTGEVSGLFASEVAKDAPPQEPARTEVDITAPVGIEASALGDLAIQVENLEKRLDKVPVEQLLRRIESTEARARKLVEAFSELQRARTSVVPDEPRNRATQELAQKSLKEIVSRLEELGSKLEEIEKRASRVLK